jgi:ADP-ribose pyrophosphatase
MEPWRKLDEHVVYSRYRRVVSKRFVQPGGKVVEYEIKDEDDMVAVLALTPAREIVLVRQFRPGPEAVLLELPAGVIEADPGPAEAAAGELLEETGYGGRIESAGTMLEEGYSNRIKHVFVAHDCRRERRPDEASPDRGSPCRPRRVPRSPPRRAYSGRRRRLPRARLPRPARIGFPI